MTSLPSVSRRVLLRFGGAAAAGTLLPGFPRLGMSHAEEAHEPHNLLFIYVSGGLDNSYLFDARPLTFTRAGKAQNYSGKDPRVWSGSNGEYTLASPITDALLPYKDRLTILRGVQMATGFDGHEQNVNYLLAGNPFGGEGMLPYFNGSSGSMKEPLDYVLVGNSPFGLTLSNTSFAVTMQPSTAKSLTTKVQSAASGGTEPPVMNLIRQRMGAVGAMGNGKFSMGAKQLLSGVGQSVGLSNLLKDVQFNGDFGQDPAIDAVALASQYFQRGICRSAFVNLRTDSFDTHDETSAAKQPEMFAKLTDTLKKVFDFLAAPDVSTGKSMLDVTTVVVTSEFGRTSYQQGKAIDKTGTDHNPLNNQVLLMGKGVKGGMVVGASDCDQLDGAGALTGISDAHKKVDGDLVKRMGKPFDFASMLPSNEMPTEFNPEHYLNFASVVNTLLKMHKVDESKYWKLTRNGSAAKTLDGILA